MRIVLALSLLTLAASVGHAQDGLLAGVVRDVAGIAIRDAQIVLQPVGSAATTNERGAFRFPSLARRRYVLTVRRIGYVPARVDVLLAERDTILEIVLQYLPLTLTSVTASAARIGLNGIVLDSSGTAISDVEVRAIPVGGMQLLPIDQRTYHQTRTDNEGVFFLPLVAGGYELRVTRSGRGSASSPVYVPRTGSRCVVVGFAFPTELIAQGRTCSALSDSLPQVVASSFPD
jgi:hypothetical protein